MEPCPHHVPPPAHPVPTILHPQGTLSPWHPVHVALHPHHTLSPGWSVPVTFRPHGTPSPRCSIPSTPCPRGTLSPRRCVLICVPTLSPARSIPAPSAPRDTAPRPPSPRLRAGLRLRLLAGARWRGASSSSLNPLLFLLSLRGRIRCCAELQPPRHRGTGTGTGTARGAHGAVPATSGGGPCVPHVCLEGAPVFRAR